MLLEVSSFHFRPPGKSAVSTKGSPTLAASRSRYRKLDSLDKTFPSSCFEMASATCSNSSPFIGFVASKVEAAAANKQYRFKAIARVDELADPAVHASSRSESEKAKRGVVVNIVATKLTTLIATSRDAQSSNTPWRLATRLRIFAHGLVKLASVWQAGYWLACRF